MMKDVWLHNYIELVIKPTEEARNKLRERVLKKGIFANKVEREYLEKYDDLLAHQYRELEKMMNDY